MTDIFDDTLSAIAAEKADAGRADDLYAKAKDKWNAIEAAYTALRGNPLPKDTVEKAAALLRTYGPKVLTRLGYPGAGAAIATVLADEGSFSGLSGVFGKVFGLFGLAG